MTAYQYVVVIVCLCIMTIEGFDVFIMGFALPHLPDGFLTDSERGLLLSSGLAGMAAGALLLAPLADRIGRRRVINLSLLVCVVGMAASTAAGSGLELTFWRLVTGIGVGSMASSVSVLVQEFTSDRMRGIVFGIFSVGFPLGSVLGGYIGAGLVHVFDGAWQAMFAFGTGLTVLALLLSVWRVPESVDFIVAKNPRGGQRQLDRIAARLRNPDVDPTARPEASQKQSSGTRSGLFEDGQTERTVLLWVSYACLMIAFYFANTWTPQLVTSATGDADAGTNAGLILSAGGFIGAIAFAVLSIKFSAAPMVWISMLVSSASMLGLAAVFGISGAALLMTTLVGTFTYIAIVAITTLVVPLYGAQSRVTAAGSMVGIGRLFSIVSPLAVGVLVTAISPEALYMLAAIPLLIGGIATYRLWRIVSAQSAETGEASVTGVDRAKPFDSEASSGVSN
ncbi:MFS transporter [Gordonia sp. (in: high G+C Gram-positive bacteria)]|uniref:MFS transporter n=1 Tax=Gordonia sp. (in: high G+C Gram-positive bacteria) TaxID=84139 RepID=UPI003F995E63